MYHHRNKIQPVKAVHMHVRSEEKLVKHKGKIIYTVWNWIKSTACSVGRYNICKHLMTFTDCRKRNNDWQALNYQYVELYH